MIFAGKACDMNHLLRLVLFLCCLQFSDVIDARPISWPGGSTIMYKSNFMMTSYYYHYSPTYKYSMGLEYIDDKHFNEKYLNFRTTYLIKRKNTQDSQGNLYITGSLSSKSSSHYNYGIHGDWETRRIFTSFSFIDKNTNVRDYMESELQIGIAPYKGEYNDLHTWIMLKSKKDTINDRWDTYPFIKFFKGDFLIEIGTDNSHWDIHYMMRF